MFRLYDFFCEHCDGEFEELVKPGEETVACPDCGDMAKLVAFCNKPSTEGSPKWREIHWKAMNIRRKLQGKIPWRKSSYSQSGNE